MIAASPALRAREREILARYTASLAAVIAEDTGTGPDDLRPWVVAHALIGTHQSLIQFVRRRLADGPVDHARLAAEVAARGREALDQLEEGLARYAVRGPLGTGRRGRARSAGWRPGSMSVPSRRHPPRPAGPGGDTTLRSAKWFLKGVRRGRSVRRGAARADWSPWP